MSELIQSIAGRLTSPMSFGSVSSAHGGGSYSITIMGRSVKAYMALGALGANTIGIGSTVMVSTNSSGRRYIVGVTPTTKSSSQVTVVIDV